MTSFRLLQLSIQPSHTIHPYMVLSHLHYKFWEKNNDITKGDRDNNEGVLH